MTKTKAPGNCDARRSNSRRNSLAHLPDYGVGDLSKIYRRMPASAHTLHREIEDTLLKYEPRLKSIEIATADREECMVLSFTMSCVLHQAGLLRYGTHFTRDRPGLHRMRTFDPERWRLRSPIAVDDPAA